MDLNFSNSRVRVRCIIFLVNLNLDSLLKTDREMDSGKDNKENQTIDVKSVLYAKNPALARAIPGFVINYLKRIVHQDELNEFLRKYGHLKNSELIAAGLQHFEIKCYTKALPQQFFLFPYMN